MSVVCPHCGMSTWVDGQCALPGCEGAAVTPEPNTDEERPVCPECRQGKHHNCDGTAWSDWTDTPTYCRCSADGHKE